MGDTPTMAMVLDLMAMDWVSVERGLLMLSPRPTLMPMLTMVPMAMDSDTLDWAMVVLDTPTMAMVSDLMAMDWVSVERGLLMLSPRPMLMLMLTMVDLDMLVWAPMAMDTLHLARLCLCLGPLMAMAIPDTFIK